MIKKIKKKIKNISRLNFTNIIIIFILLVIVLVLIKVLKYNIYNIELFNEKQLKEEYPELLVETGYSPHLYTINSLPNNEYDKYTIKNINRNLNEYIDVIYLGNPL